MISNSNAYEFNSKYHAMVSEAINQANAVEFIIDDVLAQAHFKGAPSSPTTEEYLRFLARHLQGKRLKAKCDAFLGVADVVDALVNNKISAEIANTVLKEWRQARNRFAHGLFVWNSQHVPVIYYKGYCYDIESFVREFFSLNEKVVDMLKAVENLHSAYFGKPVMKDTSCDPDYPLFADEFRNGKE